MPQELQLLSLTDNKLQEVEKAEAIEWLLLWKNGPTVISQMTSS